MKAEFVIVTIFSTVVLGQNFCPYNCGSTPNIGCNATQKMGPNCPANASVYQYSQDEITYILQVENGGRNQVANGSFSPFQSAARMLTLQWDADLAKLALFNVQTCQMQHDSCHNTAKFKFAGQNLGFLGSSDCNGLWGNMKASYKSIHDNWFNEKKDASMSDINKFTSLEGADGNEIGHFTQQVRDQNGAIGCAAAKYKNNNMCNVLVACNFGVTNIQNKPIYQAGTSCSKCQSGCSKDYPALCSTAENWDPNTF